jgi:deoxyribose-phosphate aldolase
MTPKELARFIDHTLLKADATVQEVEQLCSEALTHGFYAVCVNGSFVELARHLLDESEIKVATTVGFPLGAMESDVKRYETESAIDAGAHEIDAVLNIGWLKDRRDSLLLRELFDLVEAADERPVKVIIETALLNDEQKVRACEMVVQAGARFVKTSTGFGSGGATIQDVELLRDTVGPKFGVKASGGIRDTASALAMIEAGATRIGTSNSVKILQGLPALAVTARK